MSPGEPRERPGSRLVIYFGRWTLVGEEEAEDLAVGEVVIQWGPENDDGAFDDGAFADGGDAEQSDDPDSDAAARPA